MNTMELSRALKLNRLLAELLGQDASLRQALTLLMVAEAGDAGVEQYAIVTATDSAQSTTSRNLKILCQDLKLAEFYLDPTDGRRRLVRLTKAGRSAVAKIIGAHA